ncbi:MAG: ATP-NAD kinase family protein [Desulfurococcales archaeon]|nr:ATP-NAD kinase family protein [Desulfurococcales archaeon]
MFRLGFIVNPIAGIGGPAGFPGSDGIVEKAIIRGGYPLSPRAAYTFVSRFSELLEQPGTVEIIAAPSFMGCSYTRLLSRNSVSTICLNEEIVFPTNRSHTLRYTRVLSRHIDLLVFVGGDGTARDVLEALEGAPLPVLGVPAGVKIHSGVFASTPENAALVAYYFINGRTVLRKRPVLEYLAGKRYHYGDLYVPYVENLIQPSKSPGCLEGIEGIAEYIREMMEEELDRVYLFSSGPTIYRIMKYLGLNGSMFGVDAVFQGKVIGKQLSERDILRIIRDHGKPRLVVTPIGGQGFVLGRGARAFSSRVLEYLDKEDLIIVAPECKMLQLRVLHVDTGDPILNARFHGYVRVITGYREETVRKIV